MGPQDVIFTALVLRGHMRLHLVGLKHSKLSGTKLLTRVAEVTGHTYKRGQYQAAFDDLNAIIEAHKEAHT